VVSQVHGVWGSAIQVPGTAALNTGLSAGVTSISCHAPGNCGAGGVYSLSNGGQEAFVVSQVHGTWGRAIEVPGTAKLNIGFGAEVSSISCPSAGNCGAAGIYADTGLSGTFSNGQPFVVSEVNGTWYKAMPVPGVPRLNKGDDAWVESISCATAGNCGAGGYYTTPALTTGCATTTRPSWSAKCTGSGGERWKCPVPALRTPGS